jgi:predicted dehydrogenase
MPLSTVRVAIYGCARWANRTHIPNLIRLEGAEVGVLCDVDPEALRATAERFGIPSAHTHLDGAQDGVSPLNRTAFRFFYEGGVLDVYRQGGDTWAMGVDAVEVARKVFDPWFEQERRFIEAVRTGDRGLLLNDYRDGLYTLAPFLAGWASARRGGVCLDVGAFMEDRARG